jgi:hypothetical protein
MNSEDINYMANAILGIAARTPTTYEDVIDALTGTVISEEEAGEIKGNIEHILKTYVPF